MPNTLKSIKGYPSKLTIYQLAASRFWWVRYYVDKKVVRKSTKETDERRAVAFAKSFYDDIQLKRLTGQSPSPQTQSNFSTCADALLTAQAGRLKRGEITKISHDNDVLRMEKHIKPFFRATDVREVTYFKLEEFLTLLAHENLAQATLAYYLGLVRKVLTYAQLRGILPVLPTFPKIKKKDTPRGWFTTREYRSLCSGAKRYTNKAFLVMQDNSPKPGQKKTYILREGQTDPHKGKLIRRVKIPSDLLNVITFMVNSFIRPTDLKLMQHKHVEIVSDGVHDFLRLSLPETKGHTDPIVTLAKAVEVYLRQYENYVPSHDNKGKPLTKRQRSELAKDMYVFLPNEPDRDKALKQLQTYFALLTEELKLKHGPKGEERTLYSLRHTCIMYRFMYGDSIDVVTIARNARTSAEMIDRFYARHLSGEMNIAKIQSRRARTSPSAPTRSPAPKRVSTTNLLGKAPSKK